MNVYILMSAKINEVTYYGPFNCLPLIFFGSVDM